MNPDALKSLAGALIKIGAPTIGGILGGPLGAAGGKLAGDIIGSLADALGTDATPEAIRQKIEADPVASRPAVEAVESNQLAELQARLADVQDARSTMTTLAQSGSSIAWGAPLISAVVVVGFAILSYLAIYAPPGAQREVLLFLLGAWSSLATSVVSYWVGSSVGSRQKDSQFADILARVAQPVANAVKQVTKKGT